ncbi:MAG: HAMP domain-containing histidine kinase [Puniceicoccales bacterium]|jgi:signal transduction histidine kinase|nr:HAMP domain-containing histidine kinase [Puniceicoccales bacterium]
MKTVLGHGGEGIHGTEKNQHSTGEPDSANQVDRATDLFISTIVHEIRSPLAVMQAAVDVIESHGDTLRNTEKKNYTQSIKTAILRVTRIVDSALMLVKVRNNQVMFRPSEVNIAEFCSGVANEIECLHDGRRITVQVSKPFPLTFRIDTTLLYHVVFNLLSNAVKYSDREKPIRLKLSHGDGNLIILVKDQGIGIPRGDIKFITGLFRRGSNIGNRKGVGIGMFIVKHCVAMHNGTIEVISKENVGTTFKITIPIPQEN